MFFCRNPDRIERKLFKLTIKAYSTLSSRIIDFYEKDDELCERMTREKMDHILLEILILLVHFLDILLFGEIPSIRERVISHFCDAFSSEFPLSEIEPNVCFDVPAMFDDRMSKYGAIVRGEWLPAGYWWFGSEIEKDSVTQRFVLLGDYITYFRETGHIPIQNDVDPVLLVNPLDAEALATGFLIFQILIPGATQYMNDILAVFK